MTTAQALAIELYNLRRAPKTPRTPDEVRAYLARIFSQMAVDCSHLDVTIPAKAKRS